MYIHLTNIKARASRFRKQVQENAESPNPTTHCTVIFDLPTASSGTRFTRCCNPLSTSPNAGNSRVATDSVGKRGVCASPPTTGF